MFKSSDKASNLLVLPEVKQGNNTTQFSGFFRVRQMFFRRSEVHHCYVDALPPTGPAVLAHVTTVIREIPTTTRSVHALLHTGSSYKTFDHVNCTRKVETLTLKRVPQILLQHAAFTRCCTPVPRFLAQAKHVVEEVYTESWNGVAELMASIDGIMEGKRRSLLAQTTTMGSSCYSLSSSTSSDVSRVTITYERMKAAAPKNNTKPNTTSVPEVPPTAVTIREHLKSPIKEQRERLIALTSAFKEAERRGGAVTLKAGIMSVESSIRSLDDLLALPRPSADRPQEKEVLEARVTYQLISQLSILYVVLELANEHYHVHPYRLRLKMVETRSARHLFKGEAEDITVEEILGMPVDLLMGRTAREGSESVQPELSATEKRERSRRYSKVYYEKNAQVVRDKRRVQMAEKRWAAISTQSRTDKLTAWSRAKTRKGKKKKNKHKKIPAEQKGEEVISKAVLEEEDEMAPPTRKSGLTAAEREVSETLALMRSTRYQGDGGNLTPTREEQPYFGFDEDEEEEVGVRSISKVAADHDSPMSDGSPFPLSPIQTPAPRLAAAQRPVHGLAQRSSMRCATPPGSPSPTPPSSPEPMHSFYHHLDRFKARRHPGRRVD
ncbi:hypothetical protein C8R43DRAFT_964419 [Mycena crocata]|nr:hypothetical protein C8R43DRAFT_964419 [Mycena crocata]